LSTGIDFAALCEALTALPPEARRKLVEEALLNGYAAKDLAELMGVSPPAVSRYTRGDLAPSVGAICRLLMSVDDRLRARLLTKAARSIWIYLKTIVELIEPTAELEALLTLIADNVSELLARQHVAKRRAQGVD